MKRSRTTLQITLGLLVWLTVAGCATSKPPAADATTGSIDITITGLPAGVDAAITVSGPSSGLPQVTAATVLSGLTPGTYDVSSANVEVEDNIYYPMQPHSTLDVVAGEVAAITVAYKQQGADQGGATITVNGLPAGLPASVSVTGPNGYSHELQVSGAATLNGLPAGEYRLEGSRVVSLYGYEPAQPTQTIEVQAGTTATVTVPYAAVTGAIEFVINGLPSGAPAGVVVNVPRGDPAVVDSSGVLADQTPGAYDYQAATVITAADFTTGAVGYSYNVVANSLGSGELKAGETERIELEYGAVTSSILLVVKGLPPGAEAAVTFTLPGGPQATFQGTGAMNNLPPGTYAFSATPITSDYSFDPAPSQDSATTVAGETTVVNVDYKATEGDLALLLAEDLPGGFVVGVTVGGEHHTTGSTVRLPPGSYALGAPDKFALNGDTYQLIKGPGFADVVAGQVTRAIFSYAIAGDLSIEITGTGGSNANVVVRGANGYDSGRITASDTLRRLPVGSYEVAAYFIGPTLYPDEPSQTVLVLSEATSAVTVHYSPPVVSQSSYEEGRR